jgi:hypothetical protein
MKTLTKLRPLVIAVLIYGCATTAGNDPVVVSAEKTNSIAVETINTFLKLEREDQDLVKAKLPQVHTYANYVRVNAPKWIATAQALTAAYKNNRTPENKANLQTAQDVLSEAIRQITTYTSQIHAATP